MTRTGWLALFIMATITLSLAISLALVIAFAHGYSINGAQALDGWGVALLTTIVYGSIFFYITTQRPAKRLHMHAINALRTEVFWNIRVLSSLNSRQLPMLSLDMFNQYFHIVVMQWDPGTAEDILMLYQAFKVLQRLPQPMSELEHAESLIDLRDSLNDGVSAFLRIVPEDEIRGGTNLKDSLTKMIDSALETRARSVKSVAHPIVMNVQND